MPPMFGALPSIMEMTDNSLSAQQVSYKANQRKLPPVSGYQRTGTVGTTAMTTLCQTDPYHARFLSIFLSDNVHPKPRFGEHS